MASRLSPGPLDQALLGWMQSLDTGLSCSQKSTRVQTVAQTFRIYPAAKTHILGSNSQSVVRRLELFRGLKRQHSQCRLYKQVCKIVCNCAVQKGTMAISKASFTLSSKVTQIWYGQIRLLHVSVHRPNHVLFFCLYIILINFKAKSECKGNGKARHIYFYSTICTLGDCENEKVN